MEEEGEKNISGKSHTQNTHNLFEGVVLERGEGGKAVIDKAGPQKINDVGVFGGGKGGGGGEDKD